MGLNLGEERGQLVLGEHNVHAEVVGQAAQLRVQRRARAVLHLALARPHHQLELERRLAPRVPARKHLRVRVGPSLVLVAGSGVRIRVRVAPLHALHAHRGQALVEAEQRGGGRLLACGLRQPLVGLLERAQQQLRRGLLLLPVLSGLARQPLGLRLSQALQ